MAGGFGIRLAGLTVWRCSTDGRAAHPAGRDARATGWPGCWLLADGAEESDELAVGLRCQVGDGRRIWLGTIGNEVRQRDDHITSTHEHCFPVKRQRTALGYCQNIRCRFITNRGRV